MLHLKADACPRDPAQEPSGPLEAMAKDVLPEQHGWTHPPPCYTPPPFLRGELASPVPRDANSRGCPRAKAAAHNSMPDLDKAEGNPEIKGDSSHGFFQILSYQFWSNVM